MRQIQEILRLKYQNKLTIREIAGSCGLPTSTVGDYLKRAEVAAISWPLPEGMDEKQLLERLMATAPPETDSGAAVPDWAYIHKELGRKSVTLRLLWKEYREGHPEGYAYSRFCELYRHWADKLDPVLRQRHTPGEKMFVDWAGQTVPIHNAQDGTVSAAHLFVAVLGASNKTYAEAFENEQWVVWGHIFLFDNSTVTRSKRCCHTPPFATALPPRLTAWATAVYPIPPPSTASSLSRNRRRRCPSVMVVH